MADHARSIHVDDIPAAKARRRGRRPRMAPLRCHSLRETLQSLHNIATRMMLPAGGWSRGAWLAACLGMLASPAGAVEYRLQVANLDYLAVAAYAGPPATPLPGTNTLARLETLLDQMGLAAALIPGREVHLLDHPGYGAMVPPRLSVRPPTREQAWTTLVWDGNPSETYAFVVRTEMMAWQEAYVVAANPAGTLRLLALGGPSLFGGRAYEVPQVSYHYLANALDQRTFAAWVAHNAKSLNGMAVVIGKGDHRVYNPDRVYALLTTPAQPHTFKLVIGWCDHSDRGIGVWERFRVLRSC
jgi:hypothetical protein